MAKDSYWFKHDYNSRSDKKMAKLLMDTGVEGVGIFWCIVEMLYEENGYLMLSDCERIAFVLRTKCQKVRKVIDSELFLQDSEKFWSKSVLHRLGIKNEKSEKARQSAYLKWERNANAMRTETDRYAIRVEEKRVEEKRVATEPQKKEDLSKSNLFRQPIIPIFEEVHRVFAQQGGTEEMAKKFFNGHESTGWFFKGSPITNYATMIPGFISSWNNYKKNGYTGNGVVDTKVKIKLD